MRAEGQENTAVEKLGGAPKGILSVEPPTRATRSEWGKRGGRPRKGDVLSVGECRRQLEKVWFTDLQWVRDAAKRMGVPAPNAYWMAAEAKRIGLSDRLTLLETWLKTKAVTDRQLTTPKP